MSQRVAVVLDEEIETLGRIRVSDVERARQSIVRTARRPEEAGMIVISGSGGREFV